MLFQFISMKSFSNVVFRTSDTDVLIIFLGNIHRSDKRSRLLVEAGVASKNTLRFVDICSIYNNLGDLLSRAITRFHNLTGNNYSSALKGKAKLRPFALLESLSDFKPHLQK